MDNQRDYYESLGLARDADEKEIKSAYRKLVKKYHPDANLHDEVAEDKIKEINEAYAILSDPQKKADYDMYGHSKPERGQTRKDSGPFSGGFGSADINVDDLFSGAFGDYFRSKERKSQPGRGGDITINMAIAYAESVSGVEKDITINFSDKCKSCGGTGSRSGAAPGVCPKCNGSRHERVITQSAFGKMTQTRECAACRGTGKHVKDSCSKCSGSGYIKTDKRVKVRIPRGAINGQVITIEGLGKPGDREGMRGDLKVKLTVKPRYGF